LKKLLLFDIDGTLLRAEGSTHRAVNRTFLELFNVKETVDIRGFIGATDYGIFKDAGRKLLGREISGKELKDVEKRYLELLPVELAAVNFHVKPGVAELLALLSGMDNIILGLETGNLEISAYLKLKRGAIDHYFKFGGFGSDNENRTGIILKAIERAQKFGAVGPADTYVIGDAPNDIISGKEAGTATIAVATGLLPWQDVLATGPDYHLKDLSDPAVFLRCIGCE
jgi:phosphoglycolate phosphatase-like HAD superfamily hydrolase